MVDKEGLLPETPGRMGPALTVARHARHDDPPPVEPPLPVADHGLAAPGEVDPGGLGLVDGAERLEVLRGERLPAQRVKNVGAAAKMVKVAVNCLYAKV